MHRVVDRHIIFLGHSCGDVGFLSLSLQTERLQALLADNEKVNLSEIEPIPLPLEPQIRIRGIVPDTATLFKVQKLI